jgi:Ca2+ transporting ATPase
LYVAILTFGVLVLRMLYITMMTGNTVFLSWVNLMTILNALIIGVTIVVVAVPEGLPLAVTISLAYSVG